METGQTSGLKVLGFLNAFNIQNLCFDGQPEALRNKPVLAQVSRAPEASLLFLLIARGAKKAGWKFFFFFFQKCEGKRGWVGDGISLLLWWLF